jgi:hypothetical protein
MAVAGRSPTDALVSDFIEESALSKALVKNRGEWTSLAERH